MKIAVTGASGFIGKNLCKYLGAKGHEVFAVVRSDDKGNAFRNPNIRCRIADVCQVESLETAFEDVDVVVHLAALFNHPEHSWEDYSRTNIEGTKNVLEAAKSCGAKKVVHCSTVGVAIGTNGEPASETSPYTPHVWDRYETSKCEAEKLALEFHRRHDYPVVVVRPAQVYGPGDKSKLKFYKMVKKGIMVSPGSTQKHLIFVDDLSRAFELAAVNDKADGEIFIIGSNTTTPLEELTKLIAHQLGVPYPKFTLPATPVTWAVTLAETLSEWLRIKPIVVRRSMDFFIQSVHFDVSKARDTLGFESTVDAREGVARTARWYRENRLL